MTYGSTLKRLILSLTLMLFSAVLLSDKVDYSKLKPEMFSKLIHDQQFSDSSGSYKIINSGSTKGVKISVTVNGKTRWKRHGAYFTTHKDGSISRMQNYSYGVKQGVDESYRKDGSVSYRYIYLDGRKHGLHEIFDRKGNVTYRANFVDGRKDGLATRYEKGKISSEQEFKAGKRHGEYRQYGRRGGKWVLVGRANFQNGKQQGKTEWLYQ